MNVIAKLVAPAALVFGTFSANAAGLIETGYPLDPLPAVSTATAVTGVPGAAWTGAELDIHYPGSTATNASDATLTRKDVMRELGHSGTLMPSGTGHNA
jgi:hypothetical protein